jgi:predicted double-glycine peptidase
MRDLHFLILRAGSFSLLLSYLLLSGCANLTDSQATSFSAGGMRIHKNIKTWKDLLEQNIVMQQFDYSCGAAALATLFQYYFQDNITEKAILEDIIKHLSQQDFTHRKQEGLSLLDLKKFAERQGYQAIGVKLKFTALPQLPGPILVYLKNDEYQHFAILRGVREDRVFLADPSRGNVRMSIQAFANEWQGIALVLGKENFGTPSNYPLAIREDVLNELDATRHSWFRFITPVRLNDEVAR